VWPSPDRKRPRTDLDLLTARESSTFQIAVERSSRRRSGLFTRYCGERAEACAERSHVVRPGCRVGQVLSPGFHSFGGTRAAVRRDKRPSVGRVPSLSVRGRIGTVSIRGGTNYWTSSGNFGPVLTPSKRRPRVLIWVDVPKCRRTCTNGAHMVSLPVTGRVARPGSSVASCRLASDDRHAEPTFAVPTGVTARCHRTGAQCRGRPFARLGAGGWAQSARAGVGPVVYRRLRRPSQGKPPTGRAEKWIIVANGIRSKTFLVAGQGLPPALFGLRAVTVAPATTLDRRAGRDRPSGQRLLGQTAELRRSIPVAGGPSSTRREYGTRPPCVIFGRRSRGVASRICHACAGMIGRFIVL